MLKTMSVWRLNFSIKAGRHIRICSLRRHHLILRIYNSKCPAVPCTPSLSAAPRYNITLHPRPPSSIHGRRSSRANERPNPAFHSFEIFEAHTRLRAAGKSAVGKGVGGGTEYAHAESPLVLESVKLKINTASIT